MPRTTPYAPLFALKSHPLAPWVDRYMKDEERAERDAMLPATHRDQPYGENGFSNQAFIQAEKHLDRREVDVTFTPVYVEEAEHLFTDILCWAHSGKKIYEFGEELSTELQHTDIHEVTADDLRLPAISFYLAFNQEQPYILPDGQELDGLLVTGLLHETADLMREQHGGDQYGRLTMVLMGKARKYDPNKVSISMSCTFHTAEDTLVDAFTKTIKHYDQMYREQADVIGLTSGPAVNAALGQMHDRFRIRSKVFNDLYNLIAGALLYLTLYHDKGSEHWAPGAPEKFVRKTKGQKDEALAAYRNLAERGWSRSTYFNVSSPSISTGEGDGSSRATHWRRGHWRRQAVGPNRAERKLTWIRPILVNAHQGTLQDKTQIVNVVAPSRGKLIRTDRSPS